MGISVCVCVSTCACMRTQKSSGISLIFISDITLLVWEYHNTKIYTYSSNIDFI